MAITAKVRYLRIRSVDIEGLHSMNIVTPVRQRGVHCQLGQEEYVPPLNLNIPVRDRRASINQHRRPIRIRNNVLLFNDDWYYVLHDHSRGYKLGRPD